MSESGFKDKLFKIPFVLQSKLPFAVLPDRPYLSATFQGLMGQKLDWDHPKTFNEKLQVLKLFQQNPLFSAWMDKEQAKVLAAKKLGDDVIVKNLGVYDHVHQIDFEHLPGRYVIKTTHNSGGVWIITPEHPITDEIKKEIEASLQDAYWRQWRELAYKNVPPKILIEEFLEEDIKDYKFFCFNGDPKIILVCSNRKAGLREDFMDPDWNWLDLARARHPKSDVIPKKPALFDQMLEDARILSEGFPFVRVDLFECSGQIYFGEMTFYPACGFEGFVPEKWDRIMGDWILLEEKKAKQPG